MLDPPLPPPPTHTQDSALYMFGRQTNMCAPQPYVGTEKKPLCILFYLPFLQPANVGSERIPIKIITAWSAFA